MVKHIIVWKLKESIENKADVKNDIKTALEGLVGKIDGLTEMKILTEDFESSSGDLMMDSTLKVLPSNFKIFHIHIIKL